MSKFLNKGSYASPKNADGKILKSLDRIDIVRGRHFYGGICLNWEDKCEEIQGLKHVPRTLRHVALTKDFKTFKLILSLLNVYFHNEVTH